MRVRFLLAAETVCAAFALVGVGLVSVPAAFVVGGVAGVAACELHARGEQ